MGLTQALGSFLHILEGIMHILFKADIALKKPKENLEILNGCNADSGDFKTDHWEPSNLF